MRQSWYVLTNEIAVGDVGRGNGVSICTAALYAHNKVRQLHQNTPSMTYNNELAEKSELWAIELAETPGLGTLVHSSGADRVTGAGENLFWGASSIDFAHSLADATYSW